MNLHQHGEAQSRRSLVEITKILIRKDGSNQQHRVSPGRPGLEQLVGAQHKLLAEQWQVNGLTHLHQEIKAALEESLVGEHREATCTASGIGLGDRHRVEILTDHPFAGARFFHLSDHRRFRGGRLKRPQEILGGGKLGNLLLQVVEGNLVAGGIDLTIFFPDNLLEDVTRFLVVVGHRIFEMGHPHLGVGGTTADLHGRGKRLERKKWDGIRRPTGRQLACKRPPPPR